MDDLERRSYTDCRVQADDTKRINGYAIVFASLSHDLGGFREIIAPEAVDRTLQAGADVRALVDHDSGKVIGRTRSGTLTLRKDGHGLRVVIEPDQEISYARDVMRAVQRGDISGMSFGFRALADDWNFDGTVPVRTVTDMDVREVSIVSFPAYDATNVAVAQRSLANYAQQRPRRGLVWLTKWHKTKVA